jgi:hypothetical protein
MLVLTQTTTEILDWTINWATRGLGTDTIATSTWAISPSGLTDASPSPTFTNTTTTVWLSGGTAGTFYTITNTITTAGGREMQESFIINCIAQRFI